MNIGKLNIENSETNCYVNIRSWDTERKTFQIEVGNDKGNTETHLIKENDLQYLITKALIEANILEGGK